MERTRESLPDEGQIRAFACGRSRGCVSLARCRGAKSGSDADGCFVAIKPEGVAADVAFATIGWTAAPGRTDSLVLPGDALGAVGAIGAVKAGQAAVASREVEQADSVRRAAVGVDGAGSADGIEPVERSRPGVVFGSTRGNSQGGGDDKDVIQGAAHVRHG